MASREHRNNLSGPIRAGKLLTGLVTISFPNTTAFSAVNI